MNIDDFTDEERQIADQVISSVINASRDLDQRALVIGGYLSTQPRFRSDIDLTDEMVDAMVEHLAGCRETLDRTGVVEFGKKKIVRLSPDFWTSPDAS